METSTLGEENDDGSLSCARKRPAVVGITVVNWWKRFGGGDLPDSIREIQKRIEPLARKLAA
jgi:hypothetical protein